MTRNDNISRLSGRWRNITKECSKCEFNLENKNEICNYHGLTFHIYTKPSRIYNKCPAKLYKFRHSIS